MVTLITYNDPTYVKSEIEANPDWKLAFTLSEIDNDTAPLGWFKYIHLAIWIRTNFDEKEKK